jgi:hypothetical protein
MTSRRWSIPGLLSLLLVMLLGALPLACYKPNILDGGLKCADAGAKACPEGFRCDRGTCWRNPDGGGESRPDAVADVADARDGSDTPDVACFEALPNCTPGSGLCDPVCQSGCSGCRDKCSVNTAGALTCNPPTTTMFPRTLMQSCTTESEGTGQQTDNCAPGLACLGEQSCFARCFQFCQNDGECANSTCTRDVVPGQAGGQKVCDVPFVDTCVPLLGAANTGCGPGAMACWLSPTSPTRTFCDCPFGATPSNGPCTRTRDCVKGLTCVVPPTGQSAICLQVCRLGSVECPSGNPASCRPYFGNPAGPVANPTYGYCY